MLLVAHAPLLASLVFADPEFAIRLRAPAVEPPPADRGPRASQAALPTAPPVPYADAVPPASPRNGSHDWGGQPQARKLGTNTTIFVNFDGVHLGYCEPSNSHENCSSVEHDVRFEPYSGSLSQRVAILDAMRSMVADYGIRVTGQRPSADEPYVMVVYGGDSIKEEALGRAPAGDCWDDLPNEIAFVYLDGERGSWVNGGASTALHESAHTWGFDHIGLEGSMMAPAGGNTKTSYFDGCAQIVKDTDLNPTDGSCPQINLELCGLGDFQYDVALLKLLFGQPYVDDVAPRLRLVRPFDGVYYQGPASFHVELEVIDDLDPQIYEFAIGIPGLVDDPSFSPVIDPSFDVEELPLGEWTFELRIRDEAGNESSLAFAVVVGEQPVELDDGCACRTGSDGRGRIPAFWGLFVLFGALGLRRRGA